MKRPRAERDKMFRDWVNKGLKLDKLYNYLKQKLERGL